MGSPNIGARYKSSFNIDIDFCKDGRERVMEYTREKYGNDHVAQIITFGTMQSKGVIRDVGRALDVPLREVDRVTKMIPDGPNTPKLPVLLGLEKSDNPKKQEELEKSKNDDLIKVSKSSEVMRELFDYSLSLEGMSRHFSIHAAGVVIADRPILEYVPLAVDKRAGTPITQWAAGHLEDLGLLVRGWTRVTELRRIAQNCAELRRIARCPSPARRSP